MQTRIKTTLCSAALSSSIFISAVLCNSCTPPTPADPNREVDLMKPESEKYFVPEKTVRSSFANPGDSLLFTFNYAGVMMKNTRHNLVQADVISRVIRSPEMANKFFTFTVQGKGVDSQHATALLDHFNRHSVDLRKYEILSKDTSAGEAGSSNARLSGISGDAFKNRELTVVMQRKL